ncbi:nucleoside hydrolase [Cytophagaceae bacterium YF14B1]|uniref:Nucleoside hydrolase n=1 Tax=Xanthocytophaga flava TaxID=3048013 RepID=A0AAE3U984_9BACT|nr:nucleoside hydrolase [Xanthocytophaga flavus]MDJ1484799.1 nucleoside hydrolase [Xanthocytophaga flavus]
MTTSAKISVLLDHDGSADDFLSMVLLLLMDNVDLIGVSITPADCYGENAVETTLKLLSKAGRLDIPVGLGNLHGINAFPSEWRARPKILNALPLLINIDTTASLSTVVSSQILLTQKLKEAEAPVSILLTGPCTNLVQVLAQDPSLAQKIGSVVWMAGAIDVVGNVRTFNHDGSAEWNVFWDPISSAKLLQYSLPLTFIPLDATNAVPVTFDFLKRLALQSNHFYSDLAGQFWATTIDTIPSYDYTYFMWDVLATSYLAIPEAFTTETIEIDILSSGPGAGRTYRKPGSGQWVTIATGVNKDHFYTYLLDKFNQSPTT